MSFESDWFLSESEEEELLLLVSTLRKRRRIWVHEINQKRKKLGENKLCKELQQHSDRFFTYFRMSPETFDYLHNQLQPYIQKKNTNFRESISSKERLAICLRFLATGDTFTTISSSYRMGISTVSSIVSEVCEAIWKVLQPIYIPVPTLQTWEQISEGFYTIWGFPNCLGSIDGKHITIKSPPNSGSMFYCYKNKFSIVLLALVDAHYKFIYIDVGSYGKDSDSTIFENSTLYKLVKGRKMELPASKPLPGCENPTPHVFIGDGGFRLETFLMRPFTRESVINDPDKKKINRALSRARVVVECTFGILAQKFRIFLRPFETDINNTVKVVKAAACLHNYLQDMESAYVYENQNSTNPLGAFVSIQPNRHRANNEAFDVRQNFVNYFKS
nr:uncharacterized protein LOC110383508 [Helicoverpa armigera]